MSQTPNRQIDPAATSTLEWCLAAMAAIAAVAAGDMTDGDHARLWNAAVAKADALLVRLYAEGRS